MRSRSSAMRASAASNMACSARAFFAGRAQRLRRRPSRSCRLPPDDLRRSAAHRRLRCVRFRRPRWCRAAHCAFRRWPRAPRPVPVSSSPIRARRAVCSAICLAAASRRLSQRAFSSPIAIRRAAALAGIARQPVDSGAGFGIGAARFGGGAACGRNRFFERSAIGQLAQGLRSAWRFGLPRRSRVSRSGGGFRLRDWPAARRARRLRAAALAASPWAAISA